MVEKSTSGTDIIDARAATVTGQDSVPSQVVHLRGVDTLQLLRSEFEQCINEYRAGHYNEVKEKTTKLIYKLELNVSGQGEYLDAYAADLLHAEVLTLLGRSLERLNQISDAFFVWSKATAIFERLLGQADGQREIDPGFSDYGIALYKFGQKEKALYIFDLLYQKQRLNFEAGRYMSSCLLEMGKAEEAEKRLRQLLSLNPRNPFNHKSLGKILEALGKTAEAVDQYIMAASFFNSLEILDEALIVLDRASSLMSDDAEVRASKEAAVLSLKGVILNNLGRYEEALHLLVRSRELAGNDANTLLYLGQTLRRLKRNAEAVETLQAAIDIDPKLVEASFELSFALLELNRKEEALEELNRTLSLLPQYPLALFWKGRVLGVMGRHDEAIQAYRQTIAQDPSFKEAYENLSYMSVYLKRYDDALAVLQEGQNKNPQLSVFFQVRRSELLRYEGEFTEALAEAEQALKGDPKDPYYAKAFEAKGYALRSLNRDEEAVPAFKHAISLDETLNSSYVELTQALIALNQTEEALQIVNLALDKSTDNAVLVGLKGKLLLTQNNAEEAVTVLERAIELDPSIDWIHLELSRALYDANRLEDATDEVDKALSLNPSSLEALTYKADLLRYEQKYEEALEVINTALTLEPKDAWMLGLKGNLLRNLERDEEAIEPLTRAIELDNSQAWIHLELGKTLYTIGSYEESLASFDNALSLERNNEDALSAKGEALRILGHHEQALEVLNQALALNPDVAWALATKGQVLYELRRDQEAIPILERAVSLDPSLYWAHASLGAAYYTQGKYVESLTELNESLRQDLDSGWALFTAQVYCDIGEYNKAVEVLNRAIDVDGKNPHLLGLKGWALQSLALERAAEMLETYNTALELDPKNIWLNTGYGDALYITGELDKSRAQYKSVLEQLATETTKDRDKLSLIGWCNLRVGSYQDAVASFLDALSLTPDGITDQFNLALAIMCKGEYESAVREYQRGLDMTKSKPVLRQRGLLSVALDDLKTTTRALPELEHEEEVLKIRELIQASFDQAATKGGVVP